MAMAENNSANRGDSVSQTSPSDSENDIGTAQSPSAAATNLHTLERLATDLRCILINIRDRLWSGTYIGLVQIVIGLLSLIGLPAIFYWLNIDINDEQRLKNANNLAQNGRKIDAIDAYRSIASDAGGNNDQIVADAWLMVGRLWIEEREFEKALSAYTELIRLQPENAAAYYHRGNVRREHLDQARDAIIDYDTALSLRQNYFEAYLGKGIAESRLGWIKEAIESYSGAIRLQPRAVAVWINRGAAYSKLDENDKAFADYSEAIRLLPTYGGIYINRGDINRKLGRHGEALADYSTAIQLLPDFSYGYINRANLLLELDRYDDAFADYDEAVALDRNDPAVHYARGLAASRDPNRIDAACSDFSTALTLAQNVGAKVPRIDFRNRLVEERDANRSRVISEAVGMNSDLISKIQASVAEKCSGLEN